MDTVITEIPTVAGTPFAGGFYAGIINIAGVPHALIVAPRALGEVEEIEWNNHSTKKIAEASSFFDGLANTEALVGAGSDLGKWARNLRIAGFEDWYVPSRDELEILYRAFKPTAEENYVWRHGDNPSSVPAGYPYTEAVPAQTTAADFREGGAEAFADDWYWASTQSAGDESDAWCQGFSLGYQYGTRKDSELRARAVRRIRI